METLKTIAARRSCRAFKLGQITEEQLAALIKAGQAAPVGMKQPVHLSVVQDPALLADIEAAAGAAMGRPDAHPLYGAPTVVIASYPKELGEALGIANTACAVQNILLAATDLGLGNIFLWTANFAFKDNTQLAVRCGIPEGYVPVSTAGVGLTDEEVQTETAPKFPVGVTRK